MAIFTIELVSDDYCKIEDCVSMIIDEGFCKRHLIALSNLKDQYEKWVEAMGQIEWKDYLRMLSDNEPGNVGKNVIEVAKILLDGG